MAASNNIETATVVKCEPHKLYEMMKYTLHHLPAAFPEVFKSTDIVEGDGESVGTVRQWKYVLPGTSEVLVAKEKVELMDDENMLIVLNVFEGTVANEYSNFLTKIHVIPHGDGESTVKWTIEYGDCSEGVSHPHHYLDLYAMVNSKLEAYLAAKV